MSPRVIAFAASCAALSLAGCAERKYPWPDFHVSDDAWVPLPRPLPVAVPVARDETSHLAQGVAPMGIARAMPDETGDRSAVLTSGGSLRDPSGDERPSSFIPFGTDRHGR